MKLEPPTKFTGKGFPTVRDWLEETANWLELSPCTPDQWINIAGTRLEKGASNWFRAEKASIRTGDRDPGRTGGSSLGKLPQPSPPSQKRSRHGSS